MSNDFDILEILWLRRERKRRAQKIIEGAPPLTYTAKTAGTLKNYRIYGQTVGGESVGDLVTSGEHAGEYKVPVTVEGKNLYDGELKNRKLNWETGLETGDEATRLITNYIAVQNTNYTISSEGLEQCTIFYYGDNKQFLNNTNWRQVPYSFNSNAGYIRILFRKTDESDISALANWKIMLNAGSTPLPYEPYHTPVTTPIYLPEQIKKVGDEAEYIDYAEQKQHFADGTFVDVTLPTLPTVAGTNTLSVGTGVQPSKVMVRGKISQE